MKRLLEFALARLATLVLPLPIAFVAIAVRLISLGPTLSWNDQVGRRNSIFRSPRSAPNELAPRCCPPIC